MNQELGKSKQDMKKEKKLNKEDYWKPLEEDRSKDSLGSGAVAINIYQVVLFCI